MTKPAISLVLADDHPLVLQGLRQLIGTRPGFRIVTDCSDGVAALAAIRTHQPDVAVIDLKMPGLDGLGVLRAVAEERIRSRIVLLAATMTDTDIRTALDAGIAGIVMKDWAADTLLECITDVAAGHRWLPAPLVKQAIERETARLKFAEDTLKLLTPRERHIALLASFGLSNKQLAQACELSEGTIKLHLHNIFQKLAVTKRGDMVNVITQVRDWLETFVEQEPPQSKS